MTTHVCSGWGWSPGTTRAGAWGGRREARPGRTLASWGGATSCKGCIVSGKAPSCWQGPICPKQRHLGGIRWAYRGGKGALLLLLLLHGHAQGQEQHVSRGELCSWDCPFSPAFPSAYTVSLVLGRLETLN